jgi:hypothetical protein
MDQVTCLLPGGYVDKAGIAHRRVELASLSGRDEEFLARSNGAEGSVLVTGILSRCAQFIGTISPVSSQIARDLLVADRQYLLLKLREATFGDRIQSTIRCPWPGCTNRVDVEFSTHDIPVKESQDKGPVYRMDLSYEAAYAGDQGKMYREITFRLPNGRDQEAIMPLADKDETEVSIALLARCIQRIGPLKHPGEELIGKLSSKAREEIEEAVAPHVDLTMQALCPECGREFMHPFDLQGFFLGELRASRDLIYREVHYLAYHYHWSEREIMELPREKRREYIAVLAEEIERLNDAIRW